MTVASYFLLLSLLVSSPVVVEGKLLRGAGVAPQAANTSSRNTHNGRTFVALLQQPEQSTSPNQNNRLLVNLPQLVGYGSSPGAQYLPLQNCEGDCDSDEDCAEGLVCFQRGPSEAVPGCLDGESNLSESDFCIIPPTTTTSTPTTGRTAASSIAPVQGGGTPDQLELPHIQYVGNGEDLQILLQVCEADCDSDNDCADGLICYHREQDVDSVIPGCDGVDLSRNDYCIQSVASTSTSTIGVGMVPMLPEIMVETIMPSTESSSLSTMDVSDIGEELELTSAPTESPTDPPTQQPTALPTKRPSFAPTGMPSDTPSLVPTTTPTDTPSDVPSDIPSDIPSMVPTMSPTGMPSDVPSDVPSLVPTKPPTLAPTTIDWGYLLEARFEGNNGFGIAFPLKRCESDCDTDDECADGLICYHRRSNEPTPGCHQPDSDFDGFDFCVDPNDIPISETLPVPQPSSSPVTSSPTDAPTLPAPELSSSPETLSPTTAPTFAEPPTFRPTASPVGNDFTPTQLDELPRLQVVSNNDGNVLLDECQGDCDQDSDCMPGLVCMQRLSNEDVPGCQGSWIFSADYCIKDPAASNSESTN